jgi:hypothetical protein
MSLRPGTATIDHPTTPDPQKQVPMNPSILDTPVRTTGPALGGQSRNREMQLFPEVLARAHMQERLYEAEAERPGRRLAQARRLQQRAERASLRARRALAHAVMQ